MLLELLLSAILGAAGCKHLMGKPVRVVTTALSPAYQRIPYAHICGAYLRWL